MRGGRLSWELWWDLVLIKMTKRQVKPEKGSCMSLEQEYDELCGVVERLWFSGNIWVSCLGVVTLGSRVLRDVFGKTLF